MSDPQEQKWRELAKEQNPFIATGQSNFARDPFEFLHELHAVITALNLKKTDTLLDIGCGPGLYTVPCAALVRSVVAMDFVPAFVAAAKKNAAGYQNVRAMRGDLRRLPFRKNSFDKILVGSVLHYLEDMAEVKRVLGDLRRMLRPGGRALLTMVPDLARKESYGKGRLWFDTKEILAAAKSAGLRGKVVSVPTEVWQSCYMFSIVLDVPR